MLEKNILSSTRYYPNFAQNISHLEKYFIQAEKVFHNISKLSKSGKLRNKIKGTISKPGFEDALIIFFYSPFLLNFKR